MKFVAGREWMVDAFDCNVGFLCDLGRVQGICDQIVRDLGLNVLGQPLLHQFDDPGGVTALYMLSESHLACHTHPEYRLATFNLYCCSARCAWDWSPQLRRQLGAKSVEIRQFARGRQSTCSLNPARDGSQSARPEGVA